MMNASPIPRCSISAAKADNHPPFPPGPRYCLGYCWQRGWSAHRHLGGCSMPCRGCGCSRAEGAPVRSGECSSAMHGLEALQRPLRRSALKQQVAGDSVRQRWRPVPDLHQRCAALQSPAGGRERQRRRGSGRQTGNAPVTMLTVRADLVAAAAWQDPGRLRRREKDDKTVATAFESHLESPSTVGPVGAN